MLTGGTTILTISNDLPGLAVNGSGSSLAAEDAGVKTNGVAAFGATNAGGVMNLMGTTKIVTVGQDADAVVASGVGAITTLGMENDLSTLGDGAVGLYATAGGVITANAGSVTTTGASDPETPGITTISTGDATNGTGRNAFGAEADGQGSQINLDSLTTVTTSGAGATGLFATGGGTISTTNAASSIATTGDDAAGLYATGAGSAIIAPNGIVVTTMGANAFGAQADFGRSVDAGRRLDFDGGPGRARSFRVRLGLAGQSQRNGVLRHPRRRGGGAFRHEWRRSHGDGPDHDQYGGRRPVDLARPCRRLWRRSRRPRFADQPRLTDHRHDIGRGRNGAVRHRRRNDLNDERGEFDRDHGRRRRRPLCDRRRVGDHRPERHCGYDYGSERVWRAGRFGRSVDAGRRLDFDGGPGRARSFRVRLGLAGQSQRNGVLRHPWRRGGGAFRHEWRRSHGDGPDHDQYGGRRPVDLARPCRRLWRRSRRPRFADQPRLTDHRHDIGRGRNGAVRHRRRNDLNDERGEFDRDHGRRRRRPLCDRRRVGDHRPERHCGYDYGSERVWRTGRFRAER